MLSKKLFSVVAAFGALALAGSANAATFASFSFVGPTLFELQADQSFSVITNVTFNYAFQGDVAVPDNAPHGAQLTMAGSLTGGTGVSILGTKLQPGVLSSFSIIGNDALDIPYFGMNMLSGGSSAITMVGTAASGGMNSSQPPDAIAFTSDFIGSFGSIRSFSFSLTDVSPVFALTGANNIRKFDSSISGVFAAEAVPEPGTMAMLVGMGVAGSLVAIRRRRAVK